MPSCWETKCQAPEGITLLLAYVSLQQSFFRLLGSQEALETPKQLKLSFTHNGREFETLLNRETGAIPEGTKVTLAGDNGAKEVVEASQVYTYYSTDRNWVLAFHNHQKFEGLHLEDNTGKLTHFVGDSGKFHFYDKAEEFLNRDGRSLEGSSEVKKPLMQVDYWAGCYPGQGNGLQQLEIGVAVGLTMVRNFGQLQSTNIINSMISLSNTIYERQMDISLVVRDVFLATSSGSASFNNPGCLNGIYTQLNQLNSWSKPSGQAIWASRLAPGG